MVEAATNWKLIQPPGLLGAPIGDIDEVEPGDLVMCGYFCDNLGGGPAGARFLARQIRYFSDCANVLPGVHDLGDLNVFPLEPDKHEAAICRQLDKIATTGGIPVLVGGDNSGLDIFKRHISHRYGRDPVIHIPGPQEKPHCDTDAPSIIALDLSRWPCRGPGTVGTIRDFRHLLDRIAPAPASTVGAAVFGLAPALDWSGAAATRLARDLLAAIVTKVKKGRANAAS